MDLRPPELRMTLLERLPTSGDFTAFCLDYFPQVHAAFAAGMSRLDQTNLLLQTVGPQRVFERLQSTTTQVVSLDAPNPYRGLSVFEIKDAPLFFGRSQLVAELRQRVRELLLARPSLRILPLLGATGCGKSSLLRAGLIASFLSPGSDGVPQLPGDRIALCMPADRPLYSLAIALKRCAGERAITFDEIHTLLQQPEGLLRVYDRLADVPGDRDQPLIIAIDQLEELYAENKSASSANLLVARLLEAARSSYAIVILTTMRTDFLHALSQHPELNQVVSRNGRVVPVLDDSQLEEAITAPAARAGHALPEALTRELLRQAAGEQGSLPLVQFALQRLWPSIAASRDALEVLRQLGGIGGTLVDWADWMYMALEGGTDQLRARRLLLGLVSPKNRERPATRRLRRVADLVPARRDQALTRNLLYHFSRARHDHPHGRLLWVNQDDEVMLAHETLVTRWARLAEWLAEEGEQVLLLERLDAAIAHWKKENKAPGLLWRDPDLRKLRALRNTEEPILNLSQEEFLLACEESERKELAERAAVSEQRKRMSRFLLMTVVGLLGALVALVFGFRAERRAKNLARSSSAAALVTQPGREVQALLLAMQAAAESDELGPLWEGLYQASTILVRSELLDAAPSPFTLAVAFSGNSEQLLAGRSDGTVVVWELRRDAAPVSPRPAPRSLYRHQGAVNFVDYSPDGRYVVSAGEDGRALVFDLTTSKLLIDLDYRKYQSDKEKLSAGLLMAELSPDGSELLVAGKDRTARVFDIATGTQRRRFQHEGVVYAARYSPSGSRIVTASHDQVVRIFDPQTGVLLRAIGPSLRNQALDASAALIKQVDGHRGQVRNAIFSRDGQKLFTTGEDNAAIVWDVESGRQLVTLQGHAAAVTSIEESADGMQLLTASEDNTARLWESRSGKLLLSLSAHTGPLASAAYSADGKMIATASHDGTTRLWHPDDKDRPHRRIRAHDDWVRSAVFSPNGGKQLLTASADSTAAIWDRDSGRRLHRLEGHSQWVNSAVYNHDGSRIATAGMDGTTRIWDAATGKELATLKGQDGWVRYATFSPDGSLIATATLDKKAHIYREETGVFTLFRTLSDHGGAVSSVSFSKDGKELLTAGEDHTARRFDVQTGRVIERLERHGDWVRHAAYSQSGTQIVTASRDRTALIWTVAPDGGGASRPTQLLRGHTGWVRHAVYSGDDARILTAGADMTARLWDVKTGAQILVLTGHGGPVSTAEFSRDRRYAVTAGRDGLVLIHAIAPDILWQFGCELLRALLQHPDAPAAEVAPILSRCPLPPAGHTP